MPGLLRPSFLHQRLGIRPGSVPTFLKAKSECLGGDVFDAITTAGLFAALVLYSIIPMLAAAILVATVSTYWFIVSPFESAERLPGHGVAGKNAFTAAPRFP